MSYIIPWFFFYRHGCAALCGRYEFADRGRTSIARAFEDTGSNLYPPIVSVDSGMQVRTGTQRHHLFWVVIQHLLAVLVVRHFAFAK